MKNQKVLFSAWASCLLVITVISITEYKIVSAARSFDTNAVTKKIDYTEQVSKIFGNKSLTQTPELCDKKVTKSEPSKPVSFSTSKKAFKQTKSRKQQNAAHSRWTAKAAAALIKARNNSARNKQNGGKKSPMRPLTRKTQSNVEEKHCPLKNLTPVGVGATIKPASAHAAWHKARIKPIFTWPLDPAHFWVSSLFGMRKCAGKWALHTGVDLAAARGTPIRAAGNGVVLKASYSSGYGNYILIAHGKNFQTRYAHLDKILVKSGQRVMAGDYIGRVGATGFVRKSRRSSSGAHLHFEVYYKGKAMNPFKFLA